MERWTAQHRAFFVEGYFKNGCSVVKTQRLCRTYFNVPRRGYVPCRNTIKAWVQNFRQSASALTRKPRGRIPRVRTAENVEKLRAAIVKGPRCSARRHSASVGLPDRSVPIILHKDLNFHPYKIVTAQELNGRDMANRRISSKELPEKLNDVATIKLS
jgi:transposase-like protein